MAIAKLKAVYRSRRCLGIVSPAGVLVTRPRTTVLIISVFVLLPLLRSLRLLLLSRLIPSVLALLLPREDVLRLLVRVAARLVPLAGDLIPTGLVSRLLVGVFSVLIWVFPLPALPLLILVLSISVLGVFPLGVVVLVVSPAVVLLSLGSWTQLLSSFLLPLAPFPLHPFPLYPLPLIFFLLGPFLLWSLGVRRCLWQCGQYFGLLVVVCYRWD